MNRLSRKVKTKFVFESCFLDDEADPCLHEKPGIPRVSGGAADKMIVSQLKSLLLQIYYVQLRIVTHI